MIKKISKFVILSGAVLAISPVAASAETETEMAPQIQTNGIAVYERGSLKLAGDVQKYGLGYYGPTNAKGILTLNYYTQYGLGVGISDQTYYTIKLPKEFEEFSSHPEFKRAVAGTFTQKAIGIPLNRYNYMQQDISVENNTLVFKNPKYSYIVEGRMLMDVDIDLGNFVSKTGLHIPENEDGAGYRFMGTNTQNVNLINWSIFNYTEADAHTETSTLDFMWKPTS